MFITFRSRSPTTRCGYCLGNMATMIDDAWLCFLQQPCANSQILICSLQQASRSMHALIARACRKRLSVSWSADMGQTRLQCFCTWLEHNGSLVSSLFVFLEGDERNDPYDYEYALDENEPEEVPLPEVEAALSVALQRAQRGSGLQLQCVSLHCADHMSGQLLLACGRHLTSLQLYFRDEWQDITSMTEMAISRLSALRSLKM